MSKPPITYFPTLKQVQDKCCVVDNLCIDSRSSGRKSGRRCGAGIQYLDTFISYVLVAQNQSIYILFQLDLQDFFLVFSCLALSGNFEGVLFSC